MISQEKLSEIPFEFNGMKDTCTNITERIARVFVVFWRGVFNTFPSLLGTSSQHPLRKYGRRLPSCPEKRMV
ncbi:unnamed protein product [Orchesella dallaii]|uniref:Uncharacterized protein n=1 Tax=Orchesella dallaii TaxID=48710 RepID=A0ABP1QWB6_9HEXA